MMSTTDNNEVLDLIATSRVVPVIVVEDPGCAPGLAGALLDGGLPIAEVTLRTPGALAALEAMAAREELCVGAGTVVDAQQVDRVVDAGARFVVSPGLSESVVRRCAERGVPVFPGVATPSEIMAALGLGISVAKLFPARQLGGAAALGALAAPFPGVRFIPTGGIGAGDARSYLEHPAVLAVGGSWMATADLVRERDWPEISRRTREAVGVVKSVEAHS